MSCNMPTQSCAMHRVIQHSDVYCMLVYITMSHAYMQKIICYAGLKNSKHLHMNLKLRASCTWSEVKPSSSSSSCSWKSQHTWKSRVDRSWRTAAMTIHDTMNTDTCLWRDEDEVFEDEVLMIDNTKVIRSLAGIITWYPVMMRGSHVDVKVSSYKHLQPNTSTYGGNRLQPGNRDTHHFLSGGILQSLLEFFFHWLSTIHQRQVVDTSRVVLAIIETCWGHRTPVWVISINGQVKHNINFEERPWKGNNVTTFVPS